MVPDSGQLFRVAAVSIPSVSTALTNRSSSVCAWAVAALPKANPATTNAAAILRVV